MWRVELPLVGAGGEPVDLRRTIGSHGMADLWPLAADLDATRLVLTVPVAQERARTAVVTPGAPGTALVEAVGRPPGAREAAALVAAVRHVLRLDDDLSGFYARVAADPDLAWAARGAGRMVRSPTVFEDVAKTVCTTNCAWSATVRMVGALVEHLGPRAPGAPASGPAGRAFPSPEAMGAADEAFYRDVVRAGYRGPYLRTLAAAVASGEVDLEALADPSLPDAEVERRLLALPGVGPYAAAHVLVLLGRYHRLILDAWTRPTYARLTGRAASDRSIERRFRRYGPWAGLAFWLVLTRGWIAD